MSIANVVHGLVTGSAIALGIWILFRLFPRVAPEIRAWTWRLVLLKLAVSALALGTVTLHVLPSTPPAPPVSEIQPASPDICKSSELPVVKSTTFVAVPTSVKTVRPVKHATSLNLELIGTGIWLVGIAVLLLRAQWATVRTRRAFRLASPVTNESILECLEGLSVRSGLSRPPRLVSIAGAQSAMVCGVWRPFIVLPHRLATHVTEDLVLALGHELAHIKRRDLIWTSVAWLVRSALFFNPLVWLIERELLAAQESATDQEAVWLTGATVAAYGEMLLRAMTVDRVAWQPSGLAMFGSFHGAKRRIVAMRHFSDRPGSARRLAVATLVAIGTGCLPTYLLVPAGAASGKQTQPAAPTEAQPAKLKSKIEKRKSGHATLTTNSSKQQKRGMTGARFSAVHPVAKVKTPPSKAQPDIRFVEERTAPGIATYPQSEAFKVGAKVAQDEFDGRVKKLIEDQDNRIGDYRRGADQREREAQQREREAQQRKREGEWRARGVLLKEQVIEANEKDGYRLAGPGQRELDARQRQAADRQTEADQYQLVLDQKQRETDKWQRNFDANTMAAMRQETQANIAAERSKYQHRIAELAANDASRAKEASNAAAYTQSETIRQESGHLHTVKAASGLSFAIPDGYEVVRLQPSGKDSFTVVLRRKAK